MIFLQKGHKSYTSGLTLIETVVASAIFLVVALASYQAFTVLMNAVASAQAKVAAVALANEKFEIMRNLPYSDVGILGGLPVGKLTRSQNITKDGYNFTVLTTIRSVDDPFDGSLGGSPNDIYPADYKLADLDITCSNCKSFNPVKLTTLVAPRNVESTSTTGALFIRAFDASGSPIYGANVHIVNTATNPDTIIDETTDNSGWVKIIDAPAGTNAYNITVTKAGYSQEQTYLAGGAAGASPLKPDSTVATQTITQVNFAIDRTSTLNVSTVNASCVALPSTGFSLTGSKLIGTGVLKYPAQTFTTDASGALSVPNLEWDTYSALLTSTALDLAGTTPIPTFALNPNETKSVQLVAVPHVNRALLVTVKTSGDVPIDGATVRLQRTGFDQNKLTNSGSCATPGQAFWNGLTSATYTLTVSKTGYQTSVTSVNVSANWQQRVITLTP